MSIEQTLKQLKDQEITLKKHQSRYQTLRQRVESDLGAEILREMVAKQHELIEAAVNMKEEDLLGGSPASPQTDNSNQNDRSKDTIPQQPTTIPVETIRTSLKTAGKKTLEQTPLKVDGVIDHETVGASRKLKKCEVERT